MYKSRLIYAIIPSANLIGRLSSVCNRPKRSIAQKFSNNKKMKWASCLSHVYSLKLSTLLSQLNILRASWLISDSGFSICIYTYILYIYICIILYIVYRFLKEYRNICKSSNRACWNPSCVHFQGSPPFRPAGKMYQDRHQLSGQVGPGLAYDTLYSI